MPRGDGDRLRLASKIEQYDDRCHDHRQNPRADFLPPRYNRVGRRSRVSPSYTPYSSHHRNPRYEDDIYYTNNKSKNEFSDSDDDEELKGLSYSEYRRLKRQKLRKKLKNCIWRVTPSPPRNEGDQSEPLEDFEEDDEKTDDDLAKKKKYESSDEDDDSGNRKRRRRKRSYSDDESDEDSSSDSYDDSDHSGERKSSRKKKSRRSRNDTEEDSEDSRSRKRSYSVGESEYNSSSDSYNDSDDSGKRKTSRRRKSKNVNDDSESSDHSSSDRRRKHSRKKRSRKLKTDSEEEDSGDSANDRKKRSSRRKKRSRKSSSRRRKSSKSSGRRRIKSRRSSSSSSEESDKEEDESMSDGSLGPKKKKSSKKTDTPITSDFEINNDSKKQEIDSKKVELDPEALAFKELLESQKKNKAEETDTFVGPVPLPKAEGHISYGGALRPGEGDAIAQYVQQGKRIPRRGEVGLSADEIQKFESLGYVMSGSRHQRMNAIRIRKENQVYSAEDKRALAMFNYEEKAKREHKVMADLQRLVQRHIGQDMGPAHDPFGK